MNRLYSVCEVTILWHRIVVNTGAFIVAVAMYSLCMHIFSCVHAPIARHLKCLGLARLENRRSRNNVIETHKIVNRNYSINRDLFFLDIDDMGLKEGSD